MGSILKALIAVKEILTVVKSIYAAFISWKEKSKKEKDKGLIEEGIKERDTSKLEEAIGSANAGLPSKDPNPYIKTRDIKK